MYTLYFLAHRTSYYEITVLWPQSVLRLKNITETLFSTQHRPQILQQISPIYIIEADHFINLKIPGLIDSQIWNHLWKKKTEHDVYLKQLASRSNFVSHNHLFPQQLPKKTAQLILEFLKEI
jgi:hypothetical protein